MKWWIIAIGIIMLSSLAIAVNNPPSPTDVINLTFSGTNNPPDWDDVINLTFGTAPSGNDTCTYSGSGAWVIACNDGCNLTTNTDLLGNNIQMNGSGTITVTADITNWNDLKMFGTSTTERCTVISRSGGGFKQ